MSQTAASNVIRLVQPSAGETVTVPINADNMMLGLGFAPDPNNVAKEGQNLVFSFEDGGRIVLQGYYDHFTNKTLPVMVTEGGDQLPGEQFLASLREDLLTAAGPAAGPGAPSSGSGEYADDAGNLINGIDRLGSLGTIYWDRATEVPENYLGPIETPGGTISIGLITDVPPPDIEDGRISGTFYNVLFEDSRPNQHLDGQGAERVPGILQINIVPTGTTQVTSLDMSGFAAGTRIEIEGGRVIDINDPTDVVTFSPAEIASKISVYAPEDDLDADMDISYVVHWSTAGGVPGDVPGAFTIVVDAVADLPLKGEGSDWVCIDRQGHTETWTRQHEHEDGTVHVKTGELDSITIPVSAVFFDYQDGSEFHTIEVAGVPADWTVAGGEFGAYARIDADLDGSMFSDIDAARAALHGQSGSYAAVLGADGTVTYIFNVDGSGDVSGSITFDPHDWTGKRGADGELHLDGEGNPTRVNADISVTARAEEINLDGDEVTTLNNVATQPLADYTIGIKEDTPDFMGCKPITIISDETRGVQWFTDEIPYAAFKFDHSLQNILGDLRDAGYDLPKGFPVSVAREGIAYDLHSDGRTDGFFAGDPSRNAGKADLSFADKDGDPAGDPSGWFPSGSDQEILVYYENGVAIGRVGGPDGEIAFVVVPEGTLHNGVNHGSITFIQYMPLDHPNTGSHNEKLSDSLSLKLVLTDDDGDRTTQLITINVRDDGPHAGLVAGAVFESLFRVHDELHAQGHLIVDFGADNLDGKAVYWDLNAIAKEIADEHVQATVGPQGERHDLVVLDGSTDQSVLIGYLDAGGKPVTVIKLDLTQDSLGHYKYEYTQYDTIVQEGRGINEILEALQFKYVVKDSDGDTTRGAVAVHINDAGVLPSVDGAHLDESYDMNKTHTFNLDHIDYNAPDGVSAVTWNKALVDKALSEYHATNSDEALNVFVSQDGTILRVYDGDSDTLVFTATLTGNATDGFQVEYYQSHALSHLIPGLAHDDPLPLLLTFNVHDGDGETSLNLFAITVDDDGPEALFASNVALLGHVGQTLLEGLNDLNFQNPEAFIESLNTVMGQVVTAGLTLEGGLDVADLLFNTDLARFTGPEAMQLLFGDPEDMANHPGLFGDATHPGLVTQLTSIDFSNPITGIIQATTLLTSHPELGQALNLLVQGNPDYTGIDFTNPLGFVAGALKLVADLPDFAANPLSALLKFGGTDMDRTEHEGAVYSGKFTPDFGVDGAAGSTSQITGWEQSPHADKIPNGVGWSELGVQGMLHLLGVHATAHPDAALMVEAAGDKFPPDTLIIKAAGEDVMTLKIIANGYGSYRYEVTQHMALEHDPSAIQQLLGQLGDSLLAGGLPLDQFGLDPAMLSLLQPLLQNLSPSALIEALGSGNLLTLPLPIVIMDGDGDIAPGMISLTIRDSVPARIDGATLILSETDAHHSGPGHYEVIGTDADRNADNVGKDDVTDEHTVSGKFTFTEASYGFDGPSATKPFFWEKPAAGEYKTWGAENSAEPVDICWIVDNAAGRATLTGFDAKGHMVIQFVAVYGDPDNLDIPTGYTVTQYLPVVHLGDESENVNIPVTFGIMDGDGDTATATLNVTIRDDVPLAVSETDTLNDFTTGGTADAPTYAWTATGNIINETDTDMAGKGGDQWGADGRRPADGLQIVQPEHKIPDLNDGKGIPIAMNSQGETEIKGVYGNLFMKADGTYRYELDPAKLADAEKFDPHYGKAYVPPAQTDLGGANAALNLKGVDPANAVDGITFKGFSVAAGNLPGSVPVDGSLWGGASVKNAVATNNGIGVAGYPSGNEIGALEGLFINLHGTASGAVTLTLTNLGPTIAGAEKAIVAWYDVSGNLIANSTTDLTGDSANLATVTGPSGASYAVVLGLTASGYLGSTSFTVSAIDGVIARDGHWVDDPKWTPKENFDYILTDRDGDTANATLTIDLKAGPSKLGDPAHLYVAEADLPKGTDYIPGSEGAHKHGTDNRSDGTADDHEEFSSGSVSFLSPEGVGSVAFTGTGAAVTVTFDADGKGSWTGDIQTQYGKVIAVTLVEYADTPGKYSLEYTYQLTGNQPNTTADDGSVKQTDADGFKIVITDKYDNYDPDPITGDDKDQRVFNVKVDIQDDVPFIEAVSGADGVDGGPAGTSWQGHTLGDDIVSGLFSGETRDGSIDMTGGADGVASLKVSYLDGDDVKHEFTLAATSVSEATAQVLDTDYGQLKVWYDGAAPKYSFLADNVTGGDGDITFTFTVTDKDGDTASDTLTFGVAPLTLEFESLSVDESWLNAGGIQGSGYKDMDTPDDATPGVASALKTLGLTQAQYEALTIRGSLTEGDPAADIDISANMPASGGLDIYSDHGYLTVRYDGDTDQLSYSFTLTKNFDKHPDNPTNWDEAQEAVDQFVFAVGSSEGTLNITIYDDGLRLVDNPPAMVPIDYAPESYNIVLCLDISGSMLYDRSNILGKGADYWPQSKATMSGIGTDHGESYYEKTELFAMQVSILEMLEAYAARGAALNIGIVGFYGNAQDISGGTLDATDAAKIVSSLLPGYTVFKNTVTGEWEATYDNTAGHLGTASWLGGSTSYTAGLDAMLAKYGTLLNDPGEEVRAYFFSDGYPNTNNGDSFYENWQGYLATQATNAHFQLHTVGIDGLNRGDYFDGVNLNEAAGKHHEIPASDLTAFIKELAGTVGVYQGFLELPHTADGVIHVDANGDGKVDTGEMRGFVQKVALNGTDYELVPVNGNGFPNPTDGVVGGESVKITTEYGSFTFYANGKYTFVPTDKAGELLDDTDFAFTITFMDADGDTVAQNFSFTIQASEHFIDATADHGAVVIDEVAVHYPIGSEKAPIYVHDDIVGKENIHSNSFDPYVVIYGGGKGGSKGEISQDAAMGALSEDGFFNSFFPATIGTLTEIRELAEDTPSAGNGALTTLSPLVLALDLSEIPSGQWITAMQTAAQTAADAGKVLYVYSSTQGHEALSLTFSSLTLSGSDGKPAAVIFDGSLTNTNSLTVTGFLYIAEDFGKQGSASITGAIAVGDDFIPTAGGNISGNTVAGSIVEFQSVMQDLSVTYQNLLANDVYETMSGSVALAAGLITLDFPQFDQHNEFVDPNGFYTVTHDPANGVLTIHSVDGQYHGPLVLDYTITGQAGSDTSHLVIATPEDKAAHVQVGTVAADTLTGAVGNDILIGERGDDVIHGMAGNDTIYGDEGNDLVYGGKGDDIMFGGSGNDVFAWKADDMDSGTDVIKDFSHDFQTHLGDILRFDDLFEGGSEGQAALNALLDVGTWNGSTFNASDVNGSISLTMNGDNAMLTVVDGGHVQHVQIDNFHFAADLTAGQEAEQIAAMLQEIVKVTG